MTVAADVVEVEKLGPFTAGVGVAIALQTYDLAQISVRYGDAKTLATITTHYTLELSADFLTVTVTPTAALITAIAAGAGDKFFVRRVLPVVNDFDESDAFARSKIVRQDDKHTMVEQQLSWGKRDKETQLVTEDFADGSITTSKIANGAISLIKMAALASTALVGSISGGTPVGLTPSQVRDQVLSVYSKADIHALFSDFDTTGLDYKVPEQFGATGTADDTAVLQDAISSSFPLMLPKGLEYIVDGLEVPSNKIIFGEGKLKLKVGSANSVLDLGSSTKISISTIEIEGNSATDTGDIGSSGIRSDPGASDIRISKCYIHHCSRHGIALDANNVVIDKNRIEDIRWGAGILTGYTEYATNVSVLHNTVLRTQQGNIQSYFGVRGWRVIGNHCDSTDAGVGSGGGGEIADNITSYAEDAAGGLQDAVIANNVLQNSGNHGMHIGGDRVTINANTILNPLNSGIFAAKGDNTTPDPASILAIFGNIIKYTTNAGPTPRGIIIRNMKNFAVIGNVVDGAQVGVELNGIDTAGDGVFLGSVVANTFTMFDTYGVWLRNKITGVSITLNTMQADVSSSTNDIRDDLVSSTDTDNSIHSNFTADADTVYGQMLRAQGAGVITIGNANGEHLRVGSTTADVVNGWTAAGNITGSAPLLAVRGSDANIDAVVAPKGTGKFRLPIANVPDFADDAAATAGGVAVGGFYRNGSVLMIRAA